MNGHGHDIIRVNVGCGKNRLDGWQNYDAELDITRRLPFDNDAVDFIFAEHVVEHVTYDQAIAFFEECHRVLKSGGVLRVAVPSVERVAVHGTQRYFDWVRARGWSATADRRGAMDAVLHAHGHRSPWTSSLLATSMFFAGFDATVARDPGLSNHPELRGVEGHGKVIGDEFNFIETAICEGTKS